MNIHEYQAKALFHEYGIRVPEGHVAHSASQAQALAEDIRAEVDLLRAELDLLKRAFRRHCQDTGV